jgi:hypothetical protein
MSHLKMWQIQILGDDTNQNDIDDEIKSRLNSGNMLAIINSKIFCLPISPKNLKIKIYKIVILPFVLYGCKTWSSL